MMFSNKYPPLFTEVNYTIEPPLKGPDSRALPAAAAMAQCMNEHPDNLDDPSRVTYETVIHVQNEYGISIEVRTHKATPHQKEQRRPSLARRLAFLGSMTLRRNSTEEQHAPPQMVDDKDDSPPSSFGSRITTQVKKSLSALPFPRTDAVKTRGI